jgi:hypothetical protein
MGSTPSIPETAERIRRSLLARQAPEGWTVPEEGEPPETAPDSPIPEKQ